jgi:hypothetical protein
VKFPFEKRYPKDLHIELDLFDKVFLQKKELIRLVGRTPLEELLPPSNSKLAQNVAHVSLRTKDGSVVNGYPIMELRARVNITTNLSLARELSMTVGEFSSQELTNSSRLYDMCMIGALHKHNMKQATAFVATHTYVTLTNG